MYSVSPVILSIPVWPSAPEVQEYITTSHTTKTPQRRFGNLCLSARLYNLILVIWIWFSALLWHGEYGSVVENEYYTYGNCSWTPHLSWLFPEHCNSEVHSWYQRPWPHYPVIHLPQTRTSLRKMYRNISISIYLGTFIILHRSVTNKKSVSI